jgi:serralysin
MVLLALLALMAAWIAYSFYRSAEADRASADKDRMRAQISEREAILQKGNAITAQKGAETAANDAEKQKRKAESKEREAKKHREDAQEQAKVAEQQRNRADAMLKLLQTEMANASPEVQVILARINLPNTIRPTTAKASNGSNRPVASANRAQPRKPQQFGLKLWENGATLRIRFMDGTPEQHQKVLQIAQEWSKYANLQFEANDSFNAEIRVSLNPAGGTWSYIGTDALSIPATQPTMNLGWIEEGAVLHEFGHVLGLIHENQNPNANLPWNKEVVYREMTGPPNNWSKLAVEHNIFEMYEGIEYRDFDPDTIMMYVYSSAWFTDGRSRGGKKVLSESDRRFARRLYPLS